jgi:O-antigen ligase
VSIPSLSRSAADFGEFPLREVGRTVESPLHGAARVLLLATLFGAPWAFGAVQPWGWGALVVLSVLALVLWAAGCAHGGALRVAWSPFYWPFLAFLAIACVQLFAGLTTDRIATREAVLKLVTNFVFFFLAGQLLCPQPTNRRPLRRWGVMVSLLAAGLSVLALAQIMTSSRGLIYWTVKTTYGPYGPYVSYNDYCGIMEMLIPVSVGYILSQSASKLSRMILWLAVGVDLASIWISGSRGGTAVTLVEAVIFGFIILRHWRQAAWRRMLPLIAGLILACAAVFTFVGTGSVTNRGWSIFQTDKSFEVKLGDRFWVAKDTLRMAEKNPWRGVGVGCFEYVFPAYISQPTDLHWTHAHDDFVEALAETGFPGGFVVIWGVVVFFWLAFRNFSKTLRTDWGWIRLGAVVGSLGLCIHSLVDFNLRIPANAAWFVVCLAIVTQPYVLTERIRVLRPEPLWETDQRFVN